MTKDRRSEHLDPPALPREKVAELVSYAEHIVEMMQLEEQELRGMNHDTAEFPDVIQGWQFMALALRETYDLDDREFPGLCL